MINKLGNVLFPICSTSNCGPQGTRINAFWRAGPSAHSFPQTAHGAFFTTHYI